jgi:transposase
MDTENQRLLVHNALQTSQTKLEFQKVLCVWMKLALNLTSRQIALLLGWTPARVRKVQSRYSQQGIQYFYGKSRGGRRRENLSLSRESDILHKFVRQAKRGTSLNVSQIRKAYELSVGKPVSRSTIYRLIERHGLRRYLPRARFSPQNNRYKKNGL